jgi:precorrin-6y C5,15-methyltransferase (decarboxylating) CbiE subunit
VEIVSNLVEIVGCGPGSPDYVTPRARASVESADLLVGAERLLNLFRDVNAEKVRLGGDVEGALRTVRRGWEGGRGVSVLVTGSPGLCSLASLVLRRIGRANCRVLPGISSVQVACARVGTDWHNIQVVNAHNGKPADDIPPAEAGPKTAIFLGEPSSSRWAAAFIEDIEAPVRLFACEELTLPDEQVREVSLDDLRELSFSPRTVLLVVEEGELA